MYTNCFTNVKQIALKKYTRQTQETYNQLA